MTDSLSSTGLPASEIASHIISLPRVSVSRRIWLFYDDTEPLFIRFVSWSGTLTACVLVFAITLWSVWHMLVFLRHYLGSV
jgi:hypothetical protein